MREWALLAVFAATMAALVPLARADESPVRDELYRSQAIVTGQGEANRLPGLAECLRQVLVKVSGDPRLLTSPAVEPLLAEAGKHVSSFGYRDRLEGIPIHDEQGTYDRPHDLYCFYEPATVDALLAGLGRRPWLDERPRLVVFLGARDARRTFSLASDGEESPYMAESLLDAAAPLAMALALPPGAALSAAGLDFGTIAGTPTETLDAVARSLGGERALAGTIVWSDGDRGWVAEWRIGEGAGEHRWTIRGVSFDDAFRNAVRGAAQILSGNGEP